MIVQTKNPRTKLWFKIDKNKGQNKNISILKYDKMKVIEYKYGKDMGNTNEKEVKKNLLNKGFLSLKKLLFD